jgi:hypothetical protein
MSSKVCRGCFLVLDLDNFTRGFNQRYRKVCKKCTEKRRADSRRYIDDTSVSMISWCIRAVMKRA